MKRTLLLLVLSFCFTYGHSQDQLLSETKAFNPFKVKVLEQSDIFGVDIYWSDWYNKSQSIKTKGFSFGFNINYFYDISFTRKKKTSLAIGIGYNFFNMHNQGRLDVLQDSITGNQYTRFNHLSAQEIVDSKKNKIAINTIDVPIELRFRIKTGKDMIKIYPGFKFGYILGLSYIRKTDQGKTTITNYPDMNNWRLAPTLRIGYKDFFVFGSIDLMPIFSNEASSRFTPIRIGVSFGG